MFLIVALVTLLIFLYFTRFIERKRADSRQDRNARRQELLEQTLASAERIKNKTLTNENEQRRKDQSISG